MTCNGMAFFPSNFMLQPSHEDEHQQPQASLAPILSSSTPQDFHGVASFLGKRTSSFSGFEDSHDHDHHQIERSNMGEDEMSDDDESGSVAGEKKRRLNIEQVKTLEKNFELGNKLEPERKMQLARALGLQPRQVAIWFQNRRARWKTKQLEKDYDILKRQYDAVKSDNEALQSHNQKLHAEIVALKSRDSTESINLNKETDQGSCSNRSDNSSDINLDISRAPPAIDSPISINHQITSIPLFPPSSPLRPPPNVAQLLFQTNPSPRPDHQNVQFQKLDQLVKEESLTNMFCGIDDQTAFWPWLEQNHFN